MSTLTLGWADLMNEVAYFLGGRREVDPSIPTIWTTAEKELYDRVVKIGLRQFILPPPVGEGGDVHEWSWMRPRTTLYAWATTTGTISSVGSGGNRTITAAAASFHPAMVGHTVVSTNGSYAIVTYVSSTVVIVDADASADSAEAFTVTADGSYRLPAAYGGIDGDMTFDPGAGYYQPLPIVGEGQIEALLQGNTSTGRPQFAAIRPLAPDATAEQKFDLWVYPIPDSGYTLHYRYFVLIDALTTAAAYPPGGMVHAETIKASCLAAAELHVDDVRGERRDYFMERLAASIEHDNRAHTAKTLGYNGDPGLSRGPGHHRTNHIVTYNGVAYG